jgi:hypothetical protein
LKKGKKFAVKPIGRRSPYRAAHLDFVKNTPQFKMGGAWKDLTGALIIFHGSEKDVQDFAKNDPCVVKVG